MELNGSFQNVNFPRNNFLIRVKIKVKVEVKVKVKVKVKVDGLKHGWTNAQPKDPVTQNTGIMVSTK